MAKYTVRAGKWVAKGLRLLRKPRLYLDLASSWINPYLNSCWRQRWVGFISMLPPWPEYFPACCGCSVKYTFYSSEGDPEARFAGSVSGDRELGWGTDWGSLHVDSWGLVEALRSFVVLLLLHLLLEEFTHAVDTRRLWVSTQQGSLNQRKRVNSPASCICQIEGLHTVPFKWAMNNDVKRSKPQVAFGALVLWSRPHGLLGWGESKACQTTEVCLFGFGISFDFHLPLRIYPP